MYIKDIIDTQRIPLSTDVNYVYKYSYCIYNSMNYGIINFNYYTYINAEINHIQWVFRYPGRQISELFSLRTILLGNIFKIVRFFV